MTNYLKSILCSSMMAGACLIPAITTSQSTETETANSYQPFEGAIAASKVTREMIGKETVVEGTIRKILPSPASNVPIRLVLSEEESDLEFMIVYWQDGEAALFQGKGKPEVGDRVSSVAEVSDFKGTLQHTHKRPGKLRVEGFPHMMEETTESSPASFPKANESGYFTIEQIPALKEVMLNQDINFQGSVTGFTEAWSETAPNIIIVEEEGSKVEVVFWSEEDLAPFNVTGTEFYALGTLQDYQGRLQLKAGNPNNLSTNPFPEDRLNSVEPPAPKPVIAGNIDSWPGYDRSEINLSYPEAVKLKPYQVVSLREISPRHAGNTVTVEGNIYSLFGDSEQMAIITNEGGLLTVKLAPKHRKNTEKGKTVMVRGQLEFDETTSKMVLNSQDLVSY